MYTVSTGAIAWLCRRIWGKGDREEPPMAGEPANLPTRKTLSCSWRRSAEDKSRWMVLPHVQRHRGMEQCDGST